MPRRVLVPLVLLVAALLTFGLGVAVQRHLQQAPLRFAESFARDITGLDDPIPPAPPWEEWPYPQAVMTALRELPSVRVMDKLARPASQYAVLTTPDPFETVARFYAEKAHFEDPEAVAKSQSAASSTGTLQGEATILLDDSQAGKAADHSRPVRVKCLVRRCPSYDLAVFLSRGEHEAATHIVLLYLPKTETVDVDR